MSGTCPKCHRTGVWKMDDRRGGRDGDLRVKAWSPHEIQIIWDPFSGRKSYLWMIPEDYRRDVIAGRPDKLRACPKEVIEAIRTNSYLRFNDDYLYHGCTRAFAGIRNRGWGMPIVLQNWGHIYYNQTLGRMNEAVAMDFVVPIRLVTPASRAGASPESSDPFLSTSMGDVGAEVEGMFRQHRRDPGSVHFFPFPVDYKLLGGEASQLAPFQLLDQGQDTLLNACQIPPELYKMNLSVQNAPAMLRLFESAHRGIPTQSNKFLHFLVKRVRAYKDWPAVTAKLTPPGLLDDINKNAPKLQMVGSGLVSPQTALSSIGLKAEEEVRKTLDFQKYQQKATQEVQDELQAQGLQQQVSLPPLMQLFQGPKEIA